MKEYPLWQQFEDNKSKWIGGLLEDLDGMDQTPIVDVNIEHHDDHAYVAFIGERYTCGFNTKYGGVYPNEDKDWLYLGTPYTSFRIKQV